MCRDLLFLPLSHFVFCILPLLFVHLSVLITRLSSQRQVLFLSFYQSTLHGPLSYRQLQYFISQPQLACSYLFRRFKINSLKSFLLPNQFLFIFAFFLHVKDMHTFFFTSSLTIFYYYVCQVPSIPRVSCRIPCKIYTIKGISSAQ